MKYAYSYSFAPYSNEQVTVKSNAKDDLLRLEIQKGASAICIGPFTKEALVSELLRMADFIQSFGH